jgi:hypothetical protein
MRRGIEQGMINDVKQSYKAFSRELTGILATETGRVARRQLNAMKGAVDEVYAKATGARSERKTYTIS